MFHCKGEAPGQGVTFRAALASREDTQELGGPGETHLEGYCNNLHTLPESVGRPGHEPGRGYRDGRAGVAREGALKREGVLGHDNMPRVRDRGSQDS